MAQENQVQIISSDSEREFSVPSDLQSRILLQPSDPETKSLITSWLVSDGYLDASVDSVVSDQAQTSIFVSVGNEYILNDLVVSEAKNAGVNDQIILNTSQFEQRVFTQNLTKEISDYVLSVYEQRGFYLAEFRIVSLTKNSENASVSIKATVAPGDRIRIRGVRFQGVERNSESYLRRVAGIAGGEILTPGLQGRGRQNLVNSGLFDDVSDGELIFVDDNPYLLYEVSEQQLNFFDGLIGYQPDPSGSASIAGYGDILLRNTVANGNIIDLRYEQLQPLVSKLDLKIEQQFLGGLPLDIGAGLNFTQQDSSYLVRNFRLTSGYRLFPGFRISAQVRAERSSVTQTDILNSAIDSRANFYGVGFQIRNINRYMVPTKGFEGTVLLERGRRFINDERFQSVTGRSFSQTILQSTARGYIPLGNRPVLVPMVQAMFLESPDYLITDLFRFGGAESFRGFREDQFRGSSVVWGELEGRYMLQRNSYLFMFGAYGYYQRPPLLNEADDELAFNDSLSSFGFGLAFDTQLGIIKFSYAVSPNENLSNGNVHVGISTGL
jgi:outer membrane protein insertion porin family